jgi:PKD repeat protein
MALRSRLQTMQAQGTPTISGYAPLVVQASLSPQGGVSPFTYEIDWGDGTTSTSNSAQHTYSTPGTYTVTGKITDSLGVTAPAQATVQVLPA